MQNNFTNQKYSRLPKMKISGEKYTPIIANVPGPSP